MTARGYFFFGLVAALPLCGNADSEEPLETVRKIGNSNVELIVRSSPRPRIEALAVPGGSSLLFSDPEGLRSGIRFIALEKDGGRQKELPFDQPSKLIKSETGEAGFFAEAGTDVRRLRLEMTAVPDDDSAAVHLHLKLTNLSNQTRTLALWTIASLPDQGVVVTSVSRAIETGRRRHGNLVSYWSSPMNAPSLRLGQDAVALDLTKWTGDSSLKYGTRNNGGWAASIRPDLGTIFLGTAAYQPDASYPDEDCNITLWVGQSPSGIPYAEMEWLSAWTDVAPDESLEWTLNLEARSINPSPPPSQIDELVTLIRSPQDRPALAAHKEIADWSVDAQGPLTVDSFRRVTEFGNGRKADEKAAPSAVAPLWFNAPQLSDSALHWTADTLLQVPADAIPPWNRQIREWTVDFSADAGAGDQLLLQDGGSDSAMALTHSGTSLTVLLWNQGQTDSPAKLVAPLADSERHVATVRLRPSTGRLTLRVDSLPELSIDLPFSVSDPKRRVVLGRDFAGPVDFAGPPIGNFTGRIYRFAISLKGE